MAICVEVVEDPQKRRRTLEKSKKKRGSRANEEPNWGTDENAEWEVLLEVLKRMRMNVDFEVFEPVAGNGGTYTMSDIRGTFRNGKQMLVEVIKMGLHDHVLRKPWYYLNAIEDEEHEWGMEVYAIVKAAVVQIWEFRLSWAKLDIDPANMDSIVRQAPHECREKRTFTQKRLNIITVRWYLSVLWQVLGAEWSGVVPLPTFGPRPIVLKAMLREFYEQWKTAVLKKIEEALSARNNPDETEEEISRLIKERASRAVIEEGEEEVDDEDENKDYVIHYSEMRVDNEKNIASFHKKEVSGSGMAIAKKLGLRLSDPLKDTLPSKYYKGTPQVGDVPLSGGFPSTFSEFTNEDIFWLVVFYNESFALQCRRRQDEPNDHLFEVWWHLSYMASHGGEPPDDDEFSKSQSQPGDRRAEKKKKFIRDGFQVLHEELEFEN